MVYLRMKIEPKGSGNIYFSPDISHLIGSWLFYGYNVWIVNSYETYSIRAEPNIGFHFKGFSFKQSGETFTSNVIEKTFNETEVITAIFEKNASEPGDDPGIPGSVPPISEIITALPNSIIVKAGGKTFNVFPDGEGVSIPNNGVNIEIQYNFKNSGQYPAYFNYVTQAISDEGIAGDKIYNIPSNPYNPQFLLQPGESMTQAHFLTFGAYGASIMNWIYAKEQIGADVIFPEVLALDNKVFKVNTYPVDEPPDDNGNGDDYLWIIVIVLIVIALVIGYAKYR